MTEPGISAPASTSEVGRHLRSVRKAKGLSRAEVARSAGLTRRELAAYERGRSAVPDSDLWCLAGSCGVDVGDLLPNRDRLTVGSDLGALTVGESVHRLRAGTGNDGILREYLAMIYELRNLPAGTRPPMREEDLATLADALGGNPGAIEARLHELIGASREEAAHLRSLILPPRSLPMAPAPSALPDLAGYGAVAASSVPAPPTALERPIPLAPPMPMAFAAATPAAPAAPLNGSVPSAAPAMPSMAPPLSPLMSAPPRPMTPPMPAPPTDGSLAGSTLPSYPTPTFDFATAATSIGDADAADRFFGGPRGDDPFAPPPPLAPMAPPPGGLAPVDQLPPIDRSVVPPQPAGTFDPFAAATAAPGRPFAPPTGPPLATGAPVAFAPPAFDALDDDAGDSDLAGGGSHTGERRARRRSVAFDPPMAGDGAGPINDSDVDHWRNDAITDLEMIVLEPTDAAAPVGHGTDASFDASADADDDPFAVLRVPLAEEDWGTSSGSLGADGDAVGADPFADAFTVPEGVRLQAPEVLDTVSRTAGDDPDEPTSGFDAIDMTDVIDLAPSPGSEPGAEVLHGDEDPTDEWFDRAAAAADALIAGQNHDADPDPIRGLAPDPDPIGDPGAEPTIAEPTIAEPTIAEPTIAEPTGPEPLAGLPPIAWSVSPSGPTATPIGAAETLVASEAPAYGDFVAAGTDWEVGGIFPATAMADDGTLALRRADVRWALADLVTGADFTVRATVNFTSGAGFGILFRVSTDDSERITGYSFDIDPVYSGGGFLIRQWNDSRQHWKPLAHAPVADASRLYGPHVLDVSLRNDTLTASIDGDSVMTVNQLSRASIEAGHEPCHGGRLGVQAWSTTEVTVDRLLVANH